MSDHHGWRINPRHALIAAGLCWAGFAVMALLVSSGQVAGFDAAGLRYWRVGPEYAFRGPAWVAEAVRDVTGLGGVFLRHVFALAAIAALLWLSLRREAVMLGATIVTGWAVGASLKLLVGRPRPDIVPHLTEAAGSSFPSGHSFNAAAAFIAIALAFAAITPRRQIRWTIVGSAVALSLAVALSRVMLGVHYPSDVVAGWLAGAGWAFLASALLHRPVVVVAD